MTEQELDQHRADLQQLDAQDLRCGVMMQLHKIEALTAERDALAHKLVIECARKTILEQERDAYAKAADDMAAAHKIERDALKDAARLALDALECHADIGIKASKAINALKAVL